MWSCKSVSGIAKLAENNFNITAKLKEKPANVKNGRTKPPNEYKADPKIGPHIKPIDVDTSAIAIFYSIDFGNNWGMKA